MAIIINDYTITEFDMFEAYLRDTGELDFRLEELQDMSIDATQDKTELTGKNGRIIGYKKQNKAISGSGTVGMLSAGLLKAQTGGESESGTHTIKRSEIQTVGSTNTISIDHTATGTAGSEIGVIKVLAANGAVTEKYTQATTADETHFSYSAGTITLPNDSGTGVLTEGTKIMFAYEYEVQGTKITDPSDKFSEVREVWVHCFGTDACDNEYYISIHIPRCDFSGEFSINLGGDQTVQNFSFDGMAELCTSAGSSDLFEIYVHDDAKEGN